MAGYMFTLDSVESLHACAETGVYSTYISEPKHRTWGDPAEGTFADYATMREGDDVYFFIQRRIYGIGTLVDVGPSCRYENFPGASSPDPVDYEVTRTNMLTDEGLRMTDSGNPRLQRWICTFKPSPYFFTDGVDMDDALSSDPSAFRILRTIWKLSFIKFDDAENQAFRNAVLKLNQDALARPRRDGNVFGVLHEAVHERIRGLVRAGNYDLDARSLVRRAQRGDRVGHEMAIEAAVLYQLSTGHAPTVNALGRWDYLSHQVVASPFKPIDYMDKMDLFGYAFIPGYRPTISKYLVGEFKKDEAQPQDVDQLMKYVDWVKDEYAHGDYGMINACLVAARIPASVKNQALESAVRNFTVQRRPARTMEWSRLKMFEYSVGEDGLIALAEVEQPEQMIRL